MNLAVSSRLSYERVRSPVLSVANARLPVLGIVISVCTLLNLPSLLHAVSVLVMNRLPSALKTFLTLISYQCIADNIVS